MKQNDWKTKLLGGLMVVAIIVIAIFVLGGDRAKEATQRGYEAGRQTETKSTDNTKAVNVVGNAFAENSFNITQKDLTTKKNPKGDGTFVYVSETMYSGVERFFIWVVLEESAYPLNGPSKEITPELVFPREAPEDEWSRTGLKKFQATEAIELVFGSQK